MYSPWNQNFFLSVVRIDLADVPPSPQDWKKSCKKKMLIFVLCSASDDWLSDMSDQKLTKMQEKAP